MFSLSDILKKHKDAQNPAKPGKGAKVKVPEVRAKPPAASPELRQTAVSVSQAVAKDGNAENGIAAQALYNKALALVRAIYNKNPQDKTDFSLKLYPLIEEIILLVKANNKEFLRLVFVDDQEVVEYLPNHVLNVAVLALSLGLEMEYPHSRLKDLGVAAFLHDIGLLDYLELIYKKDIFSKEEANIVKAHPDNAVVVLNKIGKNLGKEIQEAVYCEHERLDGSGYPKGLGGNEIPDYAQIIALCDTYEAMLHKRPYRIQFPSLEIMKFILTNKRLYNRAAVKALIDRIGVFPIGTMVRLNTKESAVVIRDNLRMPLRPVVDIIIDSRGNKLAEPKRIDLSQNPVIYITE